MKSVRILIWTRIFFDDELATSWDFGKRSQLERQGYVIGPHDEYPIAMKGDIDYVGRLDGCDFLRSFTSRDHKSFYVYEDGEYVQYDPELNEIDRFPAPDEVIDKELPVVAANFDDDPDDELLVYDTELQGDFLTGWSKDGRQVFELDRIQAKSLRDVFDDHALEVRVLDMDDDGKDEISLDVYDYDSEYESLSRLVFVDENGKVLPYSGETYEDANFFYGDTNGDGDVNLFVQEWKYDDRNDSGVYPLHEIDTRGKSDSSFKGGDSKVQRYGTVWSPEQKKALFVGDYYDENSMQSTLVVEQADGKRVRSEMLADDYFWDIYSNPQQPLIATEIFDEDDLLTVYHVDHDEPIGEVISCWGFDAVDFLYDAESDTYYMLVVAAGNYIDVFRIGKKEGATKAAEALKEAEENFDAMLRKREALRSERGLGVHKSS